MLDYSVRSSVIPKMENVVKKINYDNLMSKKIQKNAPLLAIFFYFTEEGLPRSH